MDRRSSIAREQPQNQAVEHLFAKHRVVECVHIGDAAPGLAVRGVGMRFDVAADRKMKPIGADHRTGAVDRNRAYFQRQMQHGSVHIGRRFPAATRRGDRLDQSRVAGLHAERHAER
ncbi:hypothetical protein PIB19_04700 [Sphingomonas sp. 7/4-4]|uniref:hypothetical protein n=1 Tax=Sphingomonas sp. 7/4-4 TaxID=3018446 RepID=UPI0022F394C8|nr:hypothetical protein [Sphingomonas sp. 7/4-4]WBY08745.1 hypothetical protein PIB19_04700 [Sphingomonas sp. 7/4-4]